MGEEGPPSGPLGGYCDSGGRVMDNGFNFTFDFGDNLSGFMTAVLDFVNALLNSIFGTLADFFNGISINF
jgi:hypothetical protein